MTTTTTTKETDVLVGKILRARQNFYLGKLLYSKITKENFISFFVKHLSSGDFILVLEVQDQKFCKFLVLSGKHTGTVSWERRTTVAETTYFEKTQDCQ